MLSHLSFLFSLTYILVFRKLGKQQPLQAQVVLDIENSLTSPLIPSHHNFFRCTCPANSKIMFFYGFANTGTFTEVMTLGNNLFKKVSKCISQYFHCFLLVGGFVEFLLKVVSFLWILTQIFKNILSFFYAFTLLKTSAIYLLNQFFYFYVSLFFMCGL